MITGILFVDKPQGPTSHQVVAQVRRAVGTKKVGHAGTLDPMASGLMTLGIGSSTRLLTFMVGLDKTYQATIRLGFATVTDDAEGEKIGEQATAALLDALTDEKIRDTLASFVGDVVQRPSAVSAIKVSGQRAYDLVRQGVDVELKERPVTIHSISVESIRRNGSLWEVDCEVRCSSGTYIRAIARDLGEALGVGGHLSALRRTMVGPWSIDDAISLDEVDDSRVLDPAATIPDVLPVVTVDPSEALALSHGKRIRLSHNLPDVSDDDPVAAITTEGRLAAIVSGVSGPVRILVGMSHGEETT